VEATENAGPENDGRKKYQKAENAGLENDGLEFDGPEERAIMSLVHEHMYTLKTVLISLCRQTYFETVNSFTVGHRFVRACFQRSFQICVFCLTYIIRIC